MTPTTSGPAPGSGITAAPSSSAFSVLGRDMRLVRIGSTEIALRFEFVNGTAAPLAPDVLGIDGIERSLMVVDLPRGTAYEPLTAQVSTGGSATATTTRSPRTDRRP